ncbi:xanthine dehydrogenase family protein molybdopterin-binding subunit [Oceanicella sp. SM1341]|uniref:xanthine dehydrogenase family protein molybdopterin-binding subunit n=1 Tax=Oceanicella sp. SM1341 TaxID=1548889 RepID=UPI000E555F53|nr:xanthine dehydrogenase family protein molybdopterin-binding subunit [Oceanicella sp. SM1341]
MSHQESSVISEKVTRVDGPSKVRGEARYAGDQKVDGQMHAVPVLATIPAGELESIDAKQALALADGIVVLTARDMPRLHPDLDNITVPPLATRHIPMQDNLILYEGQVVALVLAPSLALATEAAKLVKPIYRTHSYINPEHQVPQSADPARGNYSGSGPLDWTKGTPDAAYASAPHKVKSIYTQPSRHANAMEPSAIVAHWHDGQLTVWDSMQHISSVQITLAAVFGLSIEDVRVIAPHTGGGFGVKAFVWPHEILAAMASKVCGKAVKFVLTRQHMYNMVGYQPQMTQHMALACDEKGQLAAIRQDVENVTSLTDDYVEFGSAAARSFYACDNISISQRVKRGNINLPTFMRAPWDGPGSWALGSALDELAHEAGIDPLDMRIRNHADTEPQTGEPWSSKMLLECYEEGARRFGWRTRPEGGTRDGYWLRGFGMADCSQGQARFQSSAGLTLTAEGTAHVASSFCDMGTGPATIFRQVAAEALGLPLSAVTSDHGQTGLPAAGPTYGQSTTISTGNAVLMAAREIKAKLAAHLQWPVAETVMEDGCIRRNNERLSIKDAMKLMGMQEIASESTFALPGGAYVDMGAPGRPARSFGALFVEVLVDPDLGLVRLRRATGVYSAGRILNPLTARSQITGGIIWGWGMATMEGSHLDPERGRWISRDLAGVPIPVNADIPADLDISFVEEFDHEAGPLGARGIGELAATGVAAAVGNAIFDATGARLHDLPITPDKILGALRLV